MRFIGNLNPRHILTRGREILRVPNEGRFMSSMDGDASWGKNGEVLAAPVEWWEKRRQQARRQYPFRYLLSEAAPNVLRKIRGQYIVRPWWKLVHRFNPQHQYHLLRTGLKPGYYDPDTRFLHGVLREVRHYAEITQGIIDWDSDDERKETYRLITEASCWYTRFCAYQKDLEKGRIPFDYDRDEEWQEQADEHLIAIMRIRRHMWYP